MASAPGKLAPEWLSTALSVTVTRFPPTAALATLGNVAGAADLERWTQPLRAK